ncbi:FeoA family protein [Maridesulfovibrio bastinii]|jgi:Fe2+ transport system protein FeoA|uniref:FeoA family protein n=1 Tax=Maridesulfovibrio bastinii TaxID=47157 RepID=UPI0003FA2544|nr:FeoA family protein [Maridesulfovibrio bastinii]
MSQNNKYFHNKPVLVCHLGCLPPAAEGIVESIKCRRGVTCRLASLGVFPSQAVIVVRVTRRGAVLLKVNGMLLAVSAGVAENIFVKEIPSAT